MDFDYDVIVIGAGPVGGYTSRLLCERGLSVLMVEEHNEGGRPFQCAGLVTPSAMDAVGAYDTVVADVDGALIHGPSGTLVPVGREGELRTYVVCRKRFDQTVVQQGLESGADLLLESQPISADVQSNGVVVEVKNQRTEEIKVLKCKLLIGCDGAHSWVRRRFKMGYPKEMMLGFQTEVVGYEGHNRWLEMYSGSEIAPGFFAWVIPSGNGTHRIGLWSKADLLDGKTVLDCYNDLLNHPLWKDRFENITETARYCGPVPSGMIRRPFKNRVMVIGDAAGMVLPSNGAGITIAMVGGRIAGQTIAEHILNGTPLTNFEKIWHQQMGRVMKNSKRSFKIGSLMFRMPDKLLDLFFNRFTKGIVWRAVTCRRMFWIF